jgi:diguanylate cyclase (GGDEF)-like protein/PAS domain S-box-containing protein
MPGAARTAARPRLMAAGAPGKEAPATVIPMLPTGTLSDVALVLASGEDFDVQMQQALALVSGGLGVVRGYVVVFSDDGRELRPTHEWCGPGVAPQVGAAPALALAALPSLPEMLAQDGVIAIEDVAALPVDLRALQQLRGVDAVLAAPLAGPEGIFGLIGFDHVGGRRSWAHADQETVRIIGGLVSTAWQRRRLEQRLAASEAALRAAHDRLANIIEGARVGTWEWDLDTDDVVLNEGWARMLGYTLAELGPATLATWQSRTHPEDQAAAVAAIDAHLDGRSDHYEQEFRLRHRDGHWVWVQARGKVVLRDGGGRPLRMAGIHTDISALKALEQQVRDLAIRDPLTGLYNRRYLMERLDDIVAEYRRYQRPFCMALLDIDHFKRVNDGFGHLAGDNVLRRFARAVEAGIREYDIFARYGGEEFVLVAPSTRAADLGAVVQRLMRQVRALAVPHEGRSIRFTFSCGLADSTELPVAAVTPESLLDLVDKRLYEAKDSGRDRCVGPPDCWSCEPTRRPLAE